ncbi:hypothetical protein LC609_27475 [Nostoc sp. XA013]|nr:hypothetical protein [Nostoc sp. XA013]
MFLLFKRNALRESHWNPLAKASDEGMALPFWLNDNPVITTSQIKGDLQDIQARCGSVSLVIVDYVQLIEPMRRERGENRVQEIDSILKQPRAIAKQFNKDLTNSEHEIEMIMFQVERVPTK